LWNVSVVPAAYGANLSFFITGANSALGKIDTDKSDNSFVVELPAIRGLLCNDTDGGINYYTKGTLVLNNTEVRTDICLNSTRGALMPRNTEIGKGISLNSTRGTLMEYYCGFNTSADYLFFDCPHGCLDGACINASVLPDENYKKLAPSNLTATSISDSIIVLNWSDNSPNEEEFRIERFTDENGGWTEIARVSSNTEHYTDYGLKQRVNYYYRVFAYTSGNYLLNGEPSNLANATTFASSGNASNEGNKSNDEGAYLELLSPNGGEELAAGQIFNITWKQKGIHNISIGYSSQSLFEWIARGVESNASFERGAYLWNVKVAPWAIEKDIRLIIEGFNNSILYSDNSNGNFTIHNSTRTQSALK